MNNSIPRGVIFGFLSWLLPTILTFVTTPILVHHLGAADYGIYLLVLGVISYTFAFAINRAVTKYVAEYYAAERFDRINEVLSATFILSLAIGALGAASLFLLSNNIVTDFLQIEIGLQAKAIAALKIAALTIALWMAGQIFSSVLQALGRFDLYSQITFATSALQTIGNAVLAYLDFGVTVLLWWNLLTIVLNGSIFYFAAKRLLPGIRLNVLPRGEVFSLVVKFSCGVVVYQIINNVLLIFERVWVTRQLGAESLQFYVVPMTLSMYVHLFINSLTMILFPLTSEISATADTERLEMIYRRTMKYICLLVVFIGAALAAASHQFLNLWLGAEFADRSSRIFVFHIFTFSLIAVGITTWQMADGLGAPSRNAWLSLSWFAVAAPLMIVLEPSFGADGVAAARAISVLSVPVSILLTEKFVFGEGLWKFWAANLVKLLVAGALCIAVVRFSLAVLPHNWLGLFLSFFSGGLIYLGAMLLFRFFSNDELRWCESFMRRAVAARA